LTFPPAMFNSYQMKSNTTIHQCNWSDLEEPLDRYVLLINHSS
jgi:hypothetical protein